MPEAEDDDQLEVTSPEPVRRRMPLRLLCPKCGSYDTRRSNHEGWMVSINQMFGRWPFRCRACRGLFFRPVPPPRD